MCRVPGGAPAGCTAQCDPAAAVSGSAHHRNPRLRQRYPAPDAQVPGEAEYCIQLPGRYPHHGICAQRAGSDHLAGAGDAGVRLPRCGVPPAGACLLPDAGAGVFQDGKLGGEPDTAGISEIHPAAKGYTADKIRTKSVIY